jgi:hypothetical protein
VPNAAIPGGGPAPAPMTPAAPIPGDLAPRAAGGAAQPAGGAAVPPNPVSQVENPPDA